MSQSSVPTEVEEFIERSISSVEQLEVLLLLASAPEKQWTIASVHQVIQSSPSSVEQRLLELCEQGFLGRKDDSYQYAPRSAALDASVQGLAVTYKQRRIRVIELIFSKPADAAKSFADAFKFKKGKDHG